MEFGILRNTGFYSYVFSLINSTIILCRNIQGEKCDLSAGTCTV